jgi:hypothetical protein
LRELFRPLPCLRFGDPCEASAVRGGHAGSSEFSRAAYGIGSHFRVLPRDFARLQNGRIAVEIEEVVTSTNTMSFQEYQEARKLHLVVAVVYNGGGFKPLLRFLRQRGILIIGLFQKLVTHIDSAPASVRSIFSSFVRLTKEELWDSEEELRAYIYADGNYNKLLNGQIGINLIQTHTAMSLAVMDDWVAYIFQEAAADLLAELDCEPGLELMFDDIRGFCSSQTHNLWGDDRNEDNPSIVLHHDVANWLHSPLSTPLSSFEFAAPVSCTFGFSPEKQEEMAALIQRYGTTATGLGRIIVQMGRNRIWREPYPRSAEPAASLAFSAAV